MSYPTHSIVYIDGSNTGITKTHDFNPGRKSWQLYAHHIKTIGDNLIIEASGNDSEIYFKQKNNPLYYKISDFRLKYTNIDTSTINISGNYNEGDVLTISGSNVQWARFDGLPNIDSSLEGKVLTVSGDNAVWADFNPLPTINSSLDGKVLTVSGDDAVWRDLPSTQNSHININSDSIKIGQNITSSSNNIIILSNSTQTQTLNYSNTILLNASSSAINVSNSGFFVNPINNSGTTISSGNSNVLYYDTIYNEIKYGTLTLSSGNEGGGGGTNNYSEPTIAIYDILANITSNSSLIADATLLSGNNYAYRASTSWDNFSNISNFNFIRFNRMIMIGELFRYINTVRSDNILIGYNNNMSGDSYLVSIGYNSRASWQSVCIGSGIVSDNDLQTDAVWPRISAAGHYTVCIGYNAYVTKASSITIGAYSLINEGGHGVSIGYRSSSLQYYSIAIGSNSYSKKISIGAHSYSDRYGTAIGAYSDSQGFACIAIGAHTNNNVAGDSMNIALGTKSTGTIGSNTIGYNAHVGGRGQYAVSIGYDSLGGASGAVSIGSRISHHGYSFSVAIGNQIIDENTITGGASYSVLFPSGMDVYVGSSQWGNSDDRLKHDELDISNAFNIVQQLQPKIYKKTRKMFNSFQHSYIDSSGNKVYQTIPERDYYTGNIIYIENTGNIGEKGNDWFYEAGLIAQDVYAIDELKEFIQVGNEENIWYLNYNNIFVYSIACLKELILKSKALENKNTLIKNKNTLIKNKLNEILREMGKNEF